MHTTEVQGPGVKVLETLHQIVRAGPSIRGGQRTTSETPKRTSTLEGRYPRDQGVEEVTHDKGVVEKDSRVGESRV